MSRSAPPFATILESLRRDLGGQLKAEIQLDQEPERLGLLDPPLSAAVMHALASLGVEALWSHQTEALAAVRAGRDVLLTTATASGKSLVFQLPVIEEALAGRPGRALFLFPLKALGQDQRAKFAALAAAVGLDESVAGCAIYDGDTPAHERAKIRRQPPRVLITNPDMLHLGLLPHAPAWHDFLRDLRWVVLDELHAYRGLFGCHVHHVLARLDRLCRAAGARPTYITASATAGEVDRFAGALVGRTFHWVASSGAPRAARHLLLVQPATSSYRTALDLYARLVRRGLKTIAFTKARRITELLWTWLERREPAIARRTRSYRAGFLAVERREIERALFAGELDGVLSTSALELGIDVGGLDACVLVGYPGSVMATWQRAGRVGRGGRESIIALVALPDALDQYLLDHPRELVDRPLERLVIDPANESVARDHLVCAAAELPLSPTEDAAYLERFAPTVGDLLAAGALARRAEGNEIVARRRRPQRDISLRGTGATYAIVESGRGASIGTVDGARVFGDCHPGAIYLHAGRQYVVEELDLERHVVRVGASDVDWYTAPRSEKETEIVEPLSERSSGSLRAGFGRLRVTERVVGFERRRTHLFEAIDVQPLDLPPVVYETHGLWLHAPPGAERACAAEGRNLLGALHAAEHATIALFPLVALCDRSDLGGISLTSHPQLGGPGLFVYEGHVGGVGIVRRGFEELPALLGHVRDLIERCPCESGCPSCIHSPKCGNGNRPLDKSGALALLRVLLEAPSPAQTSQPATTPVAPEVVPQSKPAPARRKADPPAEANTVLFDLETLRSADEVGGWDRAHRMGIAVGVVLHLEEGRFETYFEADVPRLAEALKAATLVVGFNSRRFDYAVLSGYTGERYERTLPTLDLLESLRTRLGFRVGLDHVARETLGRGKGGDGLQSLEWVKQGRLDLVEAYCKQDVELLRDVFLHGRREGFVVVSSRGAGRTRVPVDW